MSIKAFYYHLYTQHWVNTRDKNKSFKEYWKEHGQEGEEQYLTHSYDSSHPYWHGNPDIYLPDPYYHEHPGMKTRKNL